MGKIIIQFSLIVISTFAIISCKKDVEPTSVDTDLYEMAVAESGFTWFKNSNNLLKKSNGSGHPQPLLRTRYNALAATKIETSGKIMPGATFPEGSLIVKDLYDDPTTLARYAILFKDSKNQDADAKGWVWGYVNANGTVAESSSKKGSSCISCHSQANNIDYMLMNKYFP